MNNKKEVETSTPEYCITIGCKKLECMKTDPYMCADVLERLQKVLTSGRRITFEEELDTITGIDSALYNTMHGLLGVGYVEFENRLMEMKREDEGITIVVNTKSTVTVDCVEYA